MKRPILLLLTLLLLWGCHEDADTVVQEEEKPTPPTVSILTRLVSLRDTTKATDAGSVQTFANLLEPGKDAPYSVFNGQGINRDFETITYTSSDNISFHAAPPLAENDVNYYHWRLPSITTHTLHTDQEAALVLEGGFRVMIPENAVLQQDETPYLGTYTVYTALIQANNAEARSIPSFIGIESTGLPQHLLFSGCVYLSAVTPAGNLLTFDEGTELEYSATTEYQAWHFTSKNGVWNSLPAPSDRLPIHESGYYAIARPMDPVRVTGTFTVNGKRIPHQTISIQYGGQEQYVYTTNSGQWIAYVPVNTSCTISVMSGCGEAFNTSFETNSEATQSVSLAFTNDDMTSASVEGSLKDCTASPLAGQFVLMTSPYSNFLYSETSDFSFTFPVCDPSTIELSALDPHTEETSPAISWKPADTLEVHSMFVCDKAHHEYLSLTVAGESKMYWDLKSSTIGQGRILIKEGTEETDLQLDIYMTGMMEGLYDNTKLNIVFEDQHLGSKGYSLYCPTTTTGCGFTTFNVTHFPTAQGEWIRGYFEGSFWIKTFMPLTAGYQPVKGEFQVYREF